MGGRGRRSPRRRRPRAGARRHTCGTPCGGRSPPGCPAWRGWRRRRGGGGRRAPRDGGRKSADRPRAPAPSGSASAPARAARAARRRRAAARRRPGGAAAPEGRRSGGPGDVRDPGPLSNQFPSMRLSVRLGFILGHSKRCSMTAFRRDGSGRGWKNPGGGEDDASADTSETRRGAGFPAAAARLRTSKSCREKESRMRKLLFVAGLLTLAGMALGGLAAPAAAQTAPAPIVLKAARVFTSTSDRPLAPGMVIVEGDHIKQVGQNLTPPPGAVVIDLGDATLLPGFIDAHVHMAMELGENYYLDFYQGILRFPAEQALYAAHYARLTVEAGFTTVRDLGAQDFVALGLRNAINAGIAEGPRMMIANHGIGSTGGHADQSPFPPDRVKPAGTLEGVCNGPEQCREAVRYQIKYGADVIKCMPSGGVLSLVRSGGRPRADPGGDERHRLRGPRLAPQGRRPLPRRRGRQDRHRGRRRLDRARLLPEGRHPAADEGEGGLPRADPLRRLLGGGEGRPLPAGHRGEGAGGGGADAVDVPARGEDRGQSGLRHRFRGRAPRPRRPRVRPDGQERFHSGPGPARPPPPAAPTSSVSPTRSARSRPASSPTSWPCRAIPLQDIRQTEKVSFVMQGGRVIKNQAAAH